MDGQIHLSQIALSMWNPLENIVATRGFASGREGFRREKIQRIIDQPFSRKKTAGSMWKHEVGGTELLKRSWPSPLGLQPFREKGSLCRVHFFFFRWKLAEIICDSCQNCTYFRDKGDLCGFKRNRTKKQRGGVGSETFKKEKKMICLLTLKWQFWSHSNNYSTQL